MSVFVVLFDSCYNQDRNRVAVTNTLEDAIDYCMTWFDRLDHFYGFDDSFIESFRINEPAVSLEDLKIDFMRYMTTHWNSFGWRDIDQTFDIVEIDIYVAANLQRLLC